MRDAARFELDAPTSELIANATGIDIESNGVLYPVQQVSEAQPSQRGRAMLHVIEYFSKSLKVA